MARARSGITTTGHSSPLAAWIVMRLTAFPASIGGRGTWASASCSCLSHLTTVKAASDPRSRSPTSFLKPRQSVCLRSAQGCAGGYKYPSSKGIPLLCLAERCTVLHSRWYQGGIKRPTVISVKWCQKSVDYASPVPSQARGEDPSQEKEILRQSWLRSRWPSSPERRWRSVSAFRLIFPSD
jgi:hypothetical protein